MHLRDERAGLLAVGKQQPFVRSQPNGQQRVGGGRCVGREREVEAEHAVDGGQGFGIGGVQSQVDVGEEGRSKRPSSLGVGSDDWMAPSGERRAIELDMLASAGGVIEDGVATAGGDPLVVEGGHVEALAEGRLAAGDHGQSNRAPKHGAEVAGGYVASHR